MLFCSDRKRSVARVIDQAALDAFAGRPFSFGGWQKEHRQTGEQGGEQEQTAVSPGLQGMRRGEEGAAVLSHTLEPHCIIDMFTKCVSVPGNQSLL